VCCCCLQDYFIFCIFALVLQLWFFFLFVSSATKYETSAQDAFQRVVDNFILAWPTSAPTMLIFALGCRIGRLRIKGIDTLQPGELENAASVEVVCFDKTGTLTNSVVRICKHTCAAIGICYNAECDMMNILFICVQVCIFIASLGWGWGPLGWLVPSEIQPLNTRSAGQSTTTFVQLTGGATVGQTFLSMLCSMKYGKTLIKQQGACLATLFRMVDEVLRYESNNTPLLVCRLHALSSQRRRMSHSSWRRVSNRKQPPR